MKSLLRAALGTAMLGLAANALADDAMLKAGQASFESKCAICHTMSKGAPHGVGPNLDGVMGRRIASADGFSFSPALSSQAGNWDAARLDAFVKSPKDFAPGTVMPFAGLKNERERKA